jgi:hypothetical protein
MYHIRDTQITERQANENQCGGDLEQCVTSQKYRRTTSGT